MISKIESDYTYDCGNYYSILSPINNLKKYGNIKKFKKVNVGFEYSSNKNYFLNAKEIKKIISNFKMNI